MAYVDGFVLAISKARLEEYKDMARLAGSVWMEHGALSYVECLADDAPYGEETSFPRAVKAGEDDIVGFAYVTYKSRADRDEVLAKVMSDPRLSQDMENSPANMRTLIYGGFEAFLELSAT